METHVLNDKLSSELLSTSPERTSRDIMRRSILVVLAIVLGLGIATCHLALTVSGHPVLSLLLFTAVVSLVAFAFARFSPERHVLFALALAAPAILFVFTYGMFAASATHSSLWYFAPFVWLAAGFQGSFLGRRAAAVRRTPPPTGP